MTLSIIAHVGRTEETSGAKRKRQIKRLPKNENVEDGEESMKPPYEDYCYECKGYGDDYYIDDDGEWVLRCHECPYSDEEEE